MVVVHGDGAYDDRIPWSQRDSPPGPPTHRGDRARLGSRLRLHPAEPWPGERAGAVHQGGHFEGVRLPRPRGGRVQREVSPASGCLRLLQPGRVPLLLQDEGGGSPLPPLYDPPQGRAQRLLPDQARRLAAVQGLQDGSQGYQRGGRRLQRGFHLREAERFQRGGGMRLGQRQRLPEGLQAGAAPENQQGEGRGARKRKTQETLVPSRRKISASSSLIDPDERIGPKLRDSPLFIGRPPTILLKGGITTSSPLFPLLRVLYPALASSSRRSYLPKSQTDSLDLAPSPSFISKVKCECPITIFPVEMTSADGQAWPCETPNFSSPSPSTAPSAA